MDVGDQRVLNIARLTVHQAGKRGGLRVVGENGEVCAGENGTHMGSKRIRIEGKPVKECRLSSMIWTDNFWLNSKQEKDRLGNTMSELTRELDQARMTVVDEYRWKRRKQKHWQLCETAMTVRYRYSWNSRFWRFHSRGTGRRMRGWRRVSQGGFEGGGGINTSTWQGAHL